MCSSDLGDAQKPVRAAPDLQRWLCAYTWPGNVRELLNFVERLTVLWPGAEVGIADIPAAMMPRVAGYESSAAAEQEAVLSLWRWEDDDADGEAAPVANGAAAEDSSDEPHAPAAQDPAAGPPSIPQGGVDLRQLMADFESAWIREAMRMTDGNVSHAAELLGLRRTTFIERLRKYEPSDSRQ